MGKRTPDAQIDLQLDSVEGTNIHLCTDEPVNFAAIAGLMIAEAAISGSFVKANGDVSGRKTTCPAQTAMPITSTGEVDHVVITNGVDTIRNITTCPAQTLTSGGTVDVAAFAHEITDSA